MTHDNQGIISYLIRSASYAAAGDTILSMRTLSSSGRSSSSWDVLADDDAPAEAGIASVLLTWL